MRGDFDAPGDTGETKSRDMAPSEDTTQETPTPVRNLASDLKRHPRIAYQGLYDTVEQRQALLDQLPALRPFRKPYHGALVVLDWDHALPSRKLTLRVYAYYDQSSFAAGVAAYDDRLEDIGTKDRFPEFDVPDFGGLPADEAYEAELDVAGALQRMRLTSSWRRDLAPELALRCVEVVRESTEFGELQATTARRPRFLGDLEAVSWVPPCESEHSGWTVDVWYLMAFDGRMGSGQSILVDPAQSRVVTLRDFTVRTG